MSLMQTIFSIHKNRAVKIERFAVNGDGLLTVKCKWKLGNYFLGKGQYICLIV